MRVAPGALIDDGLLDVVIVEGMSARCLPAAVSELSSSAGTSRIGGCIVHRGATVFAESPSEVWIEADGEPVGKLPGTIDVLRGAVRLCGLP